MENSDPLFKILDPPLVYSEFHMQVLVSFPVINH